MGRAKRSRLPKIYERDQGFQQPYSTRHEGPQGAIDPVGERIYTLEQSEIAFRELAAGGHKVRLVLKHMLTSGSGRALS